MVQSPRLLSPTLVIQAQPLTVTPRFHTPHSSADKSPRLMMKQHSIAKNTQRDSHTFKEQRREKKEGGERIETGVLKKRAVKPINKPISENEY